RSWWDFGEAAALSRLERFVASVLCHGDFEGRGRLVAAEQSTSELSPYIRFGELSVRTVYWRARQVEGRTSQRLFQDSEYVGQGDARVHATFLRRLVWRDMAYWFLWEFPTLPTVSLRVQYEEQVWGGTARQLQRWKSGRTGFPLVDAAMRQLWAVGWMPNYLRHLVAQTLIEYLDISWKDGLQWFDWTLVDGDVAINSFMWQNGGHSGPDHWNMVLHPVHAAKACDPDGRYVRRWLPELAGVPDEFVHRPWEARVPLPISYPSRLVADLDSARRAHARGVIDVRRRHPEMVSRCGHEWLRLPGRGGLLAKLVTRDEFRAETEDFLVRQTPARRGAARKPLGAGELVLADIARQAEGG
ncbi:unnamed protein product, partial [Prorocentrum cordatum]